MFPVGAAGASWKEEPSEPIDSRNSGIVFPDNIVRWKRFEREYILHAPPQGQGQPNPYRQMLGISIRTLRNKLNELKLGEEQAVDGQLSVSVPVSVSWRLGNPKVFGLSRGWVRSHRQIAYRRFSQLRLRNYELTTNWH